MVNAVDWQHLRPSSPRARAVASAVPRRVSKFAGVAHLTAAVLTITGALAGCSAATEVASTEAPVVAQTRPPISPTPYPGPPSSPALVETEAGDAACGRLVRYDRFKPDGGEWTWDISGEPVNSAAVVGAAGTLNSDLMLYEVANGDALIGVASRFCIDDVHLQVINNRFLNGGTSEHPSIPERLSSCTPAATLPSMYTVPERAECRLVATAIDG